LHENKTVLYKKKIPDHNILKYNIGEKMKLLREKRIFEKILCFVLYYGKMCRDNIKECGMDSLQKYYKGLTGK